MFGKIFVCYDFSSPSETALNWAINLSQSFQSRLSVVHVSQGAKTSADTDALKNNLRQKIQALISQNVNFKIEPPQIHVLSGKPILALLQIIQKESPDLVVLGTRGRTGLSHVWLGSVAEKIVRHSPSPVLIVKNQTSWPPKNLLLPIDLLESAEDALMMASQLGSVFPLKTDALHVCSMPDVMTLYPNESLGQMPIDQSVLEDAALAQLKKITAHPSFEVRNHVMTGPIAAEICNWAQQRKTDIILIPTHGRSALGHLFMGSVAEQVVRYAPCSVLSFCPKQSKLHREATLKKMTSEKETITE